jgi:type II secretory pathway component PulK
MRAHPGARARPRQRGAALLLVLFIFMVLGVIALDFSKYMRDDAMAALNMVEETRGYYAAIGCMNQAIYYKIVAEQHPDLIQELAADAEAPPIVPADGTPFPISFGEHQCEVRMQDESARIPINGIAPELLKVIVENLVRSGGPAEGLDRREVNAVQTVVDSILDWTDRRDGDTPRSPYGAESAYYLGLEPPYRAKNARIDSIEELLLVRGVTADLVYGGNGRPGMVDVFTVFDGSDEDEFLDEELDDEGEDVEEIDAEDPEDPEDVESRLAEIEPLNLTTITAPMLQALLGIDRETAVELLELRWTSPEDFRNQIAVATGGNPVVQAALGGDQEIVIDEEGERDRDLGIVTIESRADVRQTRNQARIAAVVDLGLTVENGNQVAVKRWWDRAPWSLADDAGLPAAAEDGDA